MQNSRSASEQQEEPGVRARGRPRAFDRCAALAQATRLFWSKGYEATSIADLTAAMGIGSTSLYAAFGSKEALFSEALAYYMQQYAHLFWDRFDAAQTSREAVEAFLLDSAAVLTGTVVDIPRGCMATLSAVGSEGHVELGERVRAARAATFDKLTARLRRAVDDGELPAATEIQALARFVQSVQNGMTLLARDDVSADELAAVAHIAMMGWDASVAAARGAVT